MMIHDHFLIAYQTGEFASTVVSHFLKAETQALAPQRLAHILSNGTEPLFSSKIRGHLPELTKFWMSCLIQKWLKVMTCTTSIEIPY